MQHDEDDRRGAMRRFLDRFLRKRPSKAALAQRGILHDDTPKGPPLRETMLRLLVERLRVTGRGVQTEGLFRICANIHTVRQLCAQIAAPNSEKCIDLSIYDVHELGGALKMWLRECPEPVVPHEHYDAIVGTAVDGPQALRQAVHALPPMHRSILHMLLELFREVVAQSHHNLMPVSNLAIVFGPTLFRPKDPPLAVDFYLQSKGNTKGSDAITELINQFDIIFAGEPSTLSASAACTQAPTRSPPPRPPGKAAVGCANKSGGGGDKSRGFVKGSPSTTQRWRRSQHGPLGGARSGGALLGAAKLSTSRTSPGAGGSRRLSHETSPVKAAAVDGGGSGDDDGNNGGDDDDDNNGGDDDNNGDDDDDNVATSEGEHGSDGGDDEDAVAASPTTAHASTVSEGTEDEGSTAPQEHHDDGDEGDVEGKGETEAGAAEDPSDDGVFIGRGTGASEGNYSESADDDDGANAWSADDDADERVGAHATPPCGTTPIPVDAAPSGSPPGSPSASPSSASSPSTTTATAATVASDEATAVEFTVAESTPEITSETQSTSAVGEGGGGGVGGDDVGGEATANSVASQEGHATDVHDDSCGTSPAAVADAPVDPNRCPLCSNLYSITRRRKKCFHCERNVCLSTLGWDDERRLCDACLPGVKHEALYQPLKSASDACMQSAARDTTDTLEHCLALSKVLANPLHGDALPMLAQMHTSETLLQLVHRLALALHHMDVQSKRRSPRKSSPRKSQ